MTSGRNLRVLSKKKARFLLILARRIVPEVAGLTEEEQGEVVRTVDGALAEREPAIQVQFKLFMDMLRWSTLLRYGRPLDMLSPGDQDTVLRAHEETGVQKMRTGIWGLKTMVYMGYYGNPDRAGLLHYTPSLRGNEKLHG